MLACPYGSVPSQLQVTSQTAVRVDGKLLATVRDAQPMVNVLPFGLCSAPQNPEVAASMSHRPQPCKPVLTGMWESANVQVAVEGMPAVEKGAVCRCAWGGVIQSR